MKYALIENGVVAIVHVRQQDERFVEVPDEVVAGMLFDGVNFMAPSIPLEDILDAYERGLDAHIDGVVRSLSDAQGKPYRFSSITSAVSYALAGDDPRQPIAQALVAWRTAFWQAVDNVYNDVLAENRTQPTLEQLIAELPVFTFTHEV